MLAMGTMGYKEQSYREQAPLKPAESSYQPLQVFFLYRLERMLELLNHGQADVDWMRSLLNRAIYSTLLDCIREGVGQEAREMLRRAGLQSGNG